MVGRTPTHSLQAGCGSGGTASADATGEPSGIASGPRPTQPGVRRRPCGRGSPRCSSARLPGRGRAGHPRASFLAEPPAGRRPAGPPEARPARPRRGRASRSSRTSLRHRPRRPLPPPARGSRPEPRTGQRRRRSRPAAVPGQPRRPRAAPRTPTPTRSRVGRRREAASGWPARRTARWPGGRAPPRSPGRSSVRPWMAASAIGTAISARIVAQAVGRCSRRSRERPIGRCRTSPGQRVATWMTTSSSTRVEWATSAVGEGRLGPGQRLGLRQRHG